MIEGMALDIERVGAMLTMVVDVARLEAGRFRADPSEIDAGEVANWVADLFRRGPDYPAVEVRGEARVSADAERLRAILLALSDGALWWGREGPVLIDLGSDREGATLEVRRSVGGPNPEELETMFSGPGASGSKIGLHLARRQAEAQGWSLEAAGGDGIRFVLTIPKA
jgi:signal transduction histidine kinase